MKELGQNFFSRDTVTVAQDLLGKIIDFNGIRGRIVETEAYGSDPASHAFKRTERSALMHDTFGHVYVYLIYGMYFCLNFTTHKTAPGAVLIRAVEPLNELDLLKDRRGTLKEDNLCSGPGKLCQAFEISKKQNGIAVGKEIRVFDDGFSSKIFSSGRIGIKDARDLQWRFYVDSPHVSR